MNKQTMSINESSLSPSPSLPLPLSLSLSLSLSHAHTWIKSQNSISASKVLMCDSNRQVHRLISKVITKTTTPPNEALHVGI